MKRISVYCASSEGCHEDYRVAARRVGEILADRGATVVYGGGAVGSMGAVADGALSRGGEVIGVIPHFMVDLEWAHLRVTRLDRVEDMRARKHRMLEGSEGVIALPGGTGTLEELLEVLTLKRLGIYAGPVFLVNTRGYWDAFTRFLDHCVEERFMNTKHAEMWTLVDGPEALPTALDSAPQWPDDAIGFATVPPSSD